MSKTNDEVIRYWAFSLAKTGESRHLAGGTVRIDTEGTIRYYRRMSKGRLPWGPIELGRYVPRSRAIVLNGDGFTDRSGSATGWQTRLRNRVRQQMALNPGMIKHLAVIPYAALSAAEVQIDSFIPLHIVQDENEEVWHKVAEPPAREKFQAPTNPTLTGSNQILQTTQSGHQYQLTETRRYIYTDPNNTTASSATYIRGWTQGWGDWTSGTNSISIMTNTVNAAASWQGMAYYDETIFAQHLANRNELNERIANGGWGMFTAGEIPSEPGWYWRENMHHLGACLFSAVGEDGKRHKFLSAFDTDEPGQMYFLAQLPDRSGANTYEEALHVLAPTFVHEARKQGRNVRRQGDVFAVETTLSDEEVYSFAKTRVRREIVTYTMNAHVLAQVITGSRSEPEIYPGELREKIECPCKCGHKRWIGWGPKARAALSIYNTGHTADEVVVSKKGTTYIRGIMHHDPQIYEPGRAREHRDVSLGQKWHVAVRNTVPRRKTRRAEPAPVENVPTTV